MSIAPAAGPAPLPALGDPVQPRLQPRQVGWHRRLGGAQVQPQRDQQLLDAVVQVAFDPPENLVGRPTIPAARRPARPGPGCWRWRWQPVALLALPITPPSFCRWQNARTGSRAVTREGSDRYGLQLQVYAGRGPADRPQTLDQPPVPGKGRAASKRTKQVETELPARSAGQHRGSRPKAVAELIELVVGKVPERPADRASHHRRVLGPHRPLHLPSPVRSSRPAGAAILDTFYARLRAQGGRAGRLLPADLAPS
jgi:hypothetical protein